MVSSYCLFEKVIGETLHAIVIQFYAQPWPVWHIKETIIRNDWGLNDVSPQWIIIDITDSGG